MKYLQRIALLIVLLLSARSAAATIEYRISLKNPEQHSFQVSMQIPAGGAETDLLVAIPAWNALYQVRDFAYRVRDVRASGVGPQPIPLSIVKIDKQTWKISLPGTSASTVQVDYTIEWDDPGPFNSQLDAHHAFVNFAEVLMYVPNRRAEQTVVRFDDIPSGWQLAAELPAGKEPNSFLATSYDKLADAPVEAGKFEEFGFDESGAHFRVILDGKNWRRDRLENYLEKITKYELQLMGGAPYSNYTFFFHIGPYPEVGGGGMEHSNCTAISASSVESAGAIAAHEFFHVWNVKRIRPQALEPVDFTKEMYTRALWFAEGVTSTYAAYTLERAGLWSKDQFYADLAGQISELDSRPAHTWQSVEESSLDAWLEKYEDYRLPDRSISYYNKGQIDGVLLDIVIRDATENHKSLDDVMRRMNDVYAKQGRFYDDSRGIQAVAEEVAGIKLDDFFRRYVAGTDEIPYEKFLSLAGLELRVEIRKAADLGFWPASRGPNLPVTVAQVVPGTLAETAGLKAGDVLLLLNGQPFPHYLPAWLHDHSPGEKIILRVHREEKDVDLTFALGVNDLKKFSINELSPASARQKQIREGLLTGKTD